MNISKIPLLSIFSAADKSELHNTTTEVVPSPASTSCAADKSTSYIYTCMCMYKEYKFKDL